MKIFPSLSDIPMQMAGMAVVGIAYGALNQQNLKLTAIVFAIRPLALGVLFAIANPFFGGDLALLSLKTHQFVHSIVAVANLYILNKMQIVGTIGALAFAAVELLFLNVRNLKIKQMEFEASLID